VSNYSANNRQRCAPTVHQRVFTHSGPEAVVEEQQPLARAAFFAGGQSRPFAATARLPQNRGLPKVQKKSRPMKPLVEYCKGAVKALNAQYEMSNVLGHSATAGSARERLVHDFLIAHLPEMTSVVSGMIIDSSGQRSKQQDIVLMLRSMPRLPFASGHDLIFQEGAVATFEIKTQISPSTLDTIAINIESVNALVPSTLEGVQLGDLDWPYARILNVVLTYGGSPLSVIDRKLIELPTAGQPDIYLDLTKGALIKNDGVLMIQDSPARYIQVDDAGLGLARLLTLLSKVTGRLVMRGVHWDSYIS
jgi:hypothetical protein